MLGYPTWRSKAFLATTKKSKKRNLYIEDCLYWQKNPYRLQFPYQGSRIMSPLGTYPSIPFTLRPATGKSGRDMNRWTFRLCAVINQPAQVIPTCVDAHCLVQEADYLLNEHFVELTQLSREIIMVQLRSLKNQNSSHLHHDLSKVHSTKFCFSIEN